MDTYKKLSRLYVADLGLSEGIQHVLSDTQAHYLKHVMRKVIGDQLRIFNGRHGEWLAEIKEINKKNVVVEITNKLLEQKNSRNITILASPVKKEAFDLMIEKASELGASEFVPVICDHTIIHKINAGRLQTIAIEAAEQSERLDLMSITPLIKLEDALKSISYNKNIIFCLERSDKTSFIKTLQKLNGKPIAILIGPEGGFSEQEIAFINSLDNINCVSLGSQILRAETAMIAALAGVQLYSE